MQSQGRCLRDLTDEYVCCHVTAERMTMSTSERRSVCLAGGGSDDGPSALCLRSVVASYQPTLVVHTQADRQTDRQQRTAME